MRLNPFREICSSKRSDRLKLLRQLTRYDNAPFWRKSCSQIFKQRENTMRCLIENEGALTMRELCGRLMTRLRLRRQKTEEVKTCTKQPGSRQSSDCR